MAEQTQVEMALETVGEGLIQARQYLLAVKQGTRVLSQNIRGGNAVSIKKIPFASLEAKEALCFTSANGNNIDSPALFTVSFSVNNSNGERFSEKLMIDSSGGVGKFSRDSGTQHSSFKTDTGILRQLKAGMAKAGIQLEAAQAAINVLLKAIQ